MSLTPAALDELANERRVLAGEEAELAVGLQRRDEVVIEAGLAQPVPEPRRLARARPQLIDEEVLLVDVEPDAEQVVDGRHGAVWDVGAHRLAGDPAVGVERGVERLLTTDEAGLGCQIDGLHEAFVGQPAGGGWIAGDAGAEQRVVVLGGDARGGGSALRLHGHRHDPRVPSGTVGEVGDAVGVDLGQRPVVDQRSHRRQQPRVLAVAWKLAEGHLEVDDVARRGLVGDLRCDQQVRPIVARDAEDADLEVGEQLAAQLLALIRDHVLAARSGVGLTELVLALQLLVVGDDAQPGRGRTAIGDDPTLHQVSGVADVVAEADRHHDLLRIAGVPLDVAACVSDDLVAAADAEEQGCVSRSEALEHGGGHREREAAARVALRDGDRFREDVGGVPRLDAQPCGGRTARLVDERSMDRAVSHVSLPFVPLPIQGTLLQPHPRVVDELNLTDGDLGWNGPTTTLSLGSRPLDP